MTRTKTTPSTKTTEEAASVAEALSAEWGLTPERAEVFDLLAQWLGRRPDTGLFIILREDLGGTLHDPLLRANLQRRLAQAEEAEREGKSRRPKVPVSLPQGGGPVSVEERLQVQYGLGDRHLELLRLAARWVNRFPQYEGLAPHLQQLGGGAIWPPDDYLIQRIREKLSGAG